MKVVLAVLILLLAIAGGAAAGHFLRPAPADHAEDSSGGYDSAKQDSGKEDADASDRSFVKVGRQTIIPVIEDGEAVSLMLFELAVDVPAVFTDRVHQLEPRLRDAFLSELYLMARSGAFLGDFTERRVIDELRRNLSTAARRELGNDGAEVLILDVMRQKL